MALKKQQLHNDYMLLMRFAETAPPVALLPDNLHGAALRLKDFTTKERLCRNAGDVASMLLETGVRGRVVKISGEKLPKFKADQAS